MNAIEETNEKGRLEALLSLDILDTPEEPEYDELVRLAAQICGTPISTVTLVDADRQWFKASVGLTIRETPRNVSFCSHAIRQSGLFVVENAARDPRFQEFSNVTSAPGIRFYASMPIETPSGHRVGALCVIDTAPRTLTESQKDALVILARQVRGRMELRAKKRSLETALEHNRQLTAELRSQSMIFQSFVKKNPNICFFKSEDGKYLSYNARFAELFGIDEQAWLGKTDHQMRPLAVADEARALDLEVLAQDEVNETIRHLQNAAGDMVWHKAFKFPIRLSDGTSILAGVAIDITREMEKEQALSEANARLEQLATTDALTGLYNRRIFEQRMAADFAIARRNGLLFSIVAMDIDNFKKRNDTYGHAAGDEALRALAKLLLRSVRAGDVAARVGGEEFSVLLATTDTAGAKVFATRLQAMLRATDCGPGGELTVSIGIASLTASTGNWEELVIHADDALYQAKRAGKNRFIVSPENASTPSESTIDAPQD